MKNPSEMTSDEVNEAVAVEVMGDYVSMDRELGPIGWCSFGGTLLGDLPAYSTDIAAAFLVVEKMREMGWWWSGYGNSLTTTVKDVCFTFERDEDTDRPTKFKVYAPFLPRAICEAAILAVRSKP